MPLRRSSVSRKTEPSDPAGEGAFEEKLKDLNNPIRRVLDLLTEQAKLMLHDGRLKMVDGLPVLSPEIERMMAEREARQHSRCTASDPCRGVHNKKLAKAAPATSRGPSRGPRHPPGMPQD